MKGKQLLRAFDKMAQALYFTEKLISFCGINPCIHDYNVKLFYNFYHRELENKHQIKYSVQKLKNYMHNFRKKKLSRK